MRLFWIAFVMTACIGAATAAPDLRSMTGERPVMWGASAEPMPILEPGFERLFDGSNMKGWTQCGPGWFQLNKDGSMLATGGMGMLWYSKEKFRNFTLKVDWKAVKANSNSGVFVRFPDPGDDPWIAVNKGYEIQISDAGDPLHKTGSVYTFAPSSFEPKKPYGEWNTMEIRVRGTKYVVKVNGKKVAEYKGDRSAEGYIGIQNHHPDQEVCYRNIRVKREG